MFDCFLDPRPVAPPVDAAATLSLAYDGAYEVNVVERIGPGAGVGDAVARGSGGAVCMVGLTADWGVCGT